MRRSLQELTRIGLYMGTLFALFLLVAVVQSPSASAAPSTASSAAPSAQSEKPSAYTSYVTTASYLNVRAEPNARSKILTVVKKGTALSVAGKLENGWLQLEGQGFVSGTYAVPKNGKEKVQALAYKPATNKKTPPAVSYLDAQSDSGLSEAEIEELFEGTGFEGQGLEEAVLQVEEEYGINAYFTIAVMRLESGNGTSRIAKTRNNLFGLNSSKGYITFANKEASVLRFGELISRNYIGKGLTTVDKIGKKYCPANSKWASKVKGIMSSDYRSSA